MKVELCFKFEGANAVKDARDAINGAKLLGMDLIDSVAEGTWSLRNMDIHPASANVDVTQQGIRPTVNPTLLLRAVEASVLELWFSAHGFPQGFRASGGEPQGNGPIELDEDPE